MTLSLHVRHEVRPERVLEVLQGLDNGEPVDHVIQYERQVTHLRQLGLLDQYELTLLGKDLLTMYYRKPDLWGDLIHYIHYVLWDSEKGKESGFSWTYQQFINVLWSYGNLGITTDVRESLVSSLINQVEVEPNIDLSSLSKQAASISKDSLNAIINWLSALIPPVIREKSEFQRRNYCAPELLLLAIGHVAQMTDADLGIDLLLTPARREAICRLCVLEPAALEKTLNWMLPLYPQIVLPGTTAGTYGRFLRFLKWPTLADLAGR